MRKHKQMNFNIQDHILEDAARNMAKQIQEEIDFQILSDMLVSMGWHKLEFSPIQGIEDIMEINEWISKNCKGKVQSYGQNWLFEKDKDMSWFILRWGDRVDG